MTDCMVVLVLVEEDDEEEVPSMLLSLHCLPVAAVFLAHYLEQTKTWFCLEINTDYSNPNREPVSSAFLIRLHLGASAATHPRENVRE